MGSAITNDDASTKFQSSHDLNLLIKQAKWKKITVKRNNRSASIRISAVLSAALCRAHEDLKIKQKDRLDKWARLQQEKEEKFKEEREAELKKIDALWNTSELTGFNNFMNNLSQVKTCVVR